MAPEPNRYSSVTVADVARSAGVSKALHEAGWLEDVGSISSVSGGSWFNTQFAFSAEYFHGLISEESIKDW